jgi:hypothetical protein
VGQGDQVRGHQTRVGPIVTAPIFHSVPFRKLNLLQCGNWQWQTDVMGQERRFGQVRPMSALPPKATGIATRRSGRTQGANSGGSNQKSGAHS